MLRSKPLKSRSGARQVEPRPDRSAEFASYTPRARPAAPSTGLLALVTDLKPLDPQDVPSTAAGRRHMGRVAALGCVLCRRLGHGATPAEVHHLRTGQGGAQRASDFLIVPLCPDHHRGPRGLHGDKSALRQAGITELDLLADTIAEVCQ